MLLNCGVGEDSWESLGLQGDQTSPSLMKSVLNIHLKDRCWSWSSNTLVTWCKEPTHWKRCWERLKAEGEGDDRGWDGWMASLTRWSWVWANSENWWWTGKPGVLQSMGSQRVRHDWATEVNWGIVHGPKKYIRYWCLREVKVNISHFHFVPGKKKKKSKHFIDFKFIKFIYFKVSLMYFNWVRDLRENATNDEIFDYVFIELYILKS